MNVVVPKGDRQSVKLAFVVRGLLDRNTLDLANDAMLQISLLLEHPAALYATISFVLFNPGT